MLMQHAICWLKAGLRPKVMIDFSHSNSLKQFKKQIDVGNDVAAQVAAGDSRIFGVMIESNLVEGNQSLSRNIDELVYGKSITDAASVLMIPSKSLRL